MEISNLSDTEFKTLFIKMLKELGEDLSSIKKYMAQMKEQIKTPEKELNGMEISSLSDVETLVLRMLKEISEDLNSIKKIQSEMKDILIE